MKADRLRWLMNAWPPFWCAGIRVTEISQDYRQARVEMRSHWYNRNYFGVHFGGSLFAMTDPFWMLMMLKNLGKGYIVWDKRGEIEFVKPGRGTVHAQFMLEAAVIAEIRATIADGQRSLRWFETEILDANNDVVARVRKQLYIRQAAD